MVLLICVRQADCNCIHLEKQTRQPITDEVDSVEIDAHSDNLESSIGIAESDASDVGTPERVEFREGILATEQHHAPRRWRRDEIDRLKVFHFHIRLFQGKNHNVSLRFACP